MTFVKTFSYILPFAEVLIGLLLVLGLFTVLALLLAGLLMIVLTSGTVVLGAADTVAHNVMFGLEIFVLLWAAEINHYAVDRLRRKALH
jgi:thiosulfate dehydrogenase (quinone) large subunit